jgi:hypothetical protein
MIVNKINGSLKEGPLPDGPGRELPFHVQGALVLRHLAQHIQQALPLPNSIGSLELNSWSGVVQFTWDARRFTVSTSLETFELKGNTLSVTAASMLVGRILAQHLKDTKVWVAVVESLGKVEQLLTSQGSEPSVTIAYFSDGRRSTRQLFPPRTDEALALVEAVKKRIRNHLQSKKFFTKR